MGRPGSSRPGPGPRTGRRLGEPGGDGAGRTDIVDWFDGAFENLREELRSLSSGMTQQEAMVAELLDTRQGELRLVLVAEALPDLVAESVRQAMADHLAGLTESFDSAMGQFRIELKRVKKSTDAAIDSLRETVTGAIAEVNATVAAQTSELQETEAARARAIKAAVTRQVTPLVTALEESSARVDADLGLLSRKLDRMAAAVEKAGVIVPATTPRARGAASKPAKPPMKQPPKVDETTPS